MFTPTPPAGPKPSSGVFWSMLGAIVASMLKNKAHADIIITIKGGEVQIVRVNQSFLPEALPRV